MEIQITLAYALKHGQPVDRFIINTTDVEKVAALVNQYKVNETSVTCPSDDNQTWRDFMEYFGQKSVVYEIPRKYTDAFNLYTKMLKMAFFK